MVWWHFSRICGGKGQMHGSARNQKVGVILTCVIQNNDVPLAKAAFRDRLKDKLSYTADDDDDFIYPDASP
jgi:hypothetical protein